MVNKFTVAVVAGLLLFGNSASAASTDWKLPIKKATPGAINLNVTQENIKDNICKSGWTATIRPPVTYTNKLKADQLTTTYKTFVKIYGADLSLYEEDHLISLQLGGSPTDPKNLFPQPYAGNNARKKDIVETKLKRLVCDGTITLKVAQTAIAKNWVLAYNKYVTSKDTTIEAIN
jgi:hypothetical protein